MSVLQETKSQDFGKAQDTLFYNIMKSLTNNISITSLMTVLNIQSLG